MENELLFKKAIDNHCKKTGEKVYKVKARLGKKLYGDDIPVNMNGNINNLYNGKKKNVSPEHIQIVCDDLMITPNEFFGFPEVSEGTAQKIVSKIVKIISES